MRQFEEVIQWSNKGNIAQDNTNIRQEKEWPGFWIPDSFRHSHPVAISDGKSCMLTSAGRTHTVSAGILCRAASTCLFALKVRVEDAEDAAAARPGARVHTSLPQQPNLLRQGHVREARVGVVAGPHCQRGKPRVRSELSPSTHTYANPVGLAHQHETQTSACRRQSGAACR